MPGWLPQPTVRLGFLHLNSLLYEKQSEFFSAEDEIVFGPLSPLNKTMILHFIYFLYFSLSALSDSPCAKCSDMRTAGHINQSRKCLPGSAG